MSVVTDRPAPAVLRIRIDRPRFRNAIDGSVREGLAAALADACEDTDTGALVIGGTCGMFSAGGDLPSLVGLSEEEAYQRLRQGHAIVSLLWEFPKPVVAAVERYAIGAGAGLAILADVVVAGEHAKFGFPFARLGLRPDWGLSASLPRRIGEGAAARLVETAASCGGPEALAIGLADVVVNDDCVAAEAIAQASRLAELPAGAFAGDKVLRRGNAETQLGLDAEARDQARRITSPQFAEAYEKWRAGSEKRS